MIEPAIPAKETVRITLPSGRPAETVSESREGGRINSLIRSSNDMIASRGVAGVQTFKPGTLASGALGRRAAMDRG